MDWCSDCGKVKTPNRCSICSAYVCSSCTRDHRCNGWDTLLLSPRRLFYAGLSWLLFVRLGDYTYTLREYLRYWRRSQSAEHDGSEFFVK